MGSYDVYDFARDDQFATPSYLPPAVGQFWNTFKWKAFRILRKWSPRFADYLLDQERRIAPWRYARWRRQQDKRWRARLPRKMERQAITLDARTADQLQSRFFQLPLEVRDEIYGYIFDGGTVRLNVQEKVDGKVVRNKEPYRLRNLEPQQCFAIVQACKRTYVEASHLFYAANTFIFPDLTTFLSFERLVPSRHWHLITSICLTWDYPDVVFDFQYHRFPCPSNEQTWEEACRAVSQMEGLERLRVVLFGRAMSPYQDDDYVLAQPLREVTRPGVFQYFVREERKAFYGRCGCGCGRAKGFHGSGPWDVARVQGYSD